MSEEDQAQEFINNASRVNAAHKAELPAYVSSYRAGCAARRRNSMVSDCAVNELRPTAREVNQDFVHRSTCPACKSAALRNVFSCEYGAPLIRDYLDRHYNGLATLDRLRGETFTVLRCDHCSLLFQPLAPAGSLIQDVYDRWIPPLSPQQIYAREDLQSCRYRNDQIDFLIQTVGLKPWQMRFLDFGSGWSEWLIAARSFGCEVAGSELSLERLAYAQAVGIPMLHWDEIVQNRFEVINLEQVLEHLVDPLEVLTHLRESLDKNGVLRVGVPDGRKMEKRLTSLTPHEAVDPGALMPIQPLEHLNCFTHTSLLAIGKAAGFRPLRLSLRKLYNSMNGWGTVKGFGRNLTRPLYRHVYPRSTIMFFERC